MSGKDKKVQRKEGGLESLLDSGWNLLKSMKFAIIILVVIAIASVFNLFANEFITPVQGDTDRIEQVYRELYGDFRANLLLFFQMYSPYRSWWYTLLLGLLTFSLTVCVIDRAPHDFKKAFRPRYVRSENLYREGEFSGSFDLAENPTEALNGLLRRRGYRVRSSSEDDRVYIDGSKHSVAIIGSWLVHAGFILLIIGGAMIARGQYHTRVSGLPGEMLAPSEEEWGFNVRVDDFRIEYYPLYKGQLVEVDGRILGRITAKETDSTFTLETYRPEEGILEGVAAERISNRIERRMGGGRLDQANIADYVAVLTVIENGKEIVTREVEVNFPLRYNGYRFYQSSFNDRRTDAQGRWTTVIEVRKDRGSVLVWIGIGIVSLGVFIALYLVPRRISGLVRPSAAGGYQLMILGNTTRNREIFRMEFSGIVAAMRERKGENGERS